MLYTLQQAFDYCNRYVKDGSCSFDEVASFINDALERITDFGELECMQAVLRINTDKISFTLPYNVEKILAANLNGMPANMYGRMYQFLSSGPGDLDDYNWGGAYRDFLDQGSFPVQFDLPDTYEIQGEHYHKQDRGLRLCAFSSRKEDVGKTISVRGFTYGAEEVHAGIGAMGEDIVINRWGQNGREGVVEGLPGVSLEIGKQRFDDITQVVKPITKGYVTLMACETTSDWTNAKDQFWTFLAKYHPRETIPQFRRYAVTGYESPCCPACILALVRMRHVPLVDPDDILPIDSLQALRAAVQSLSAELKGDLASAGGYFQTAMGLMNKREQTRTTDSGPKVPNIDFRNSPGRFMNRAARRLI